MASFLSFRTKVDGWKTGIFAVALAAGGVLQTSDIAEVVPVGWEGKSLILIGVIVAVLRVVTKGPLGSKD